MHLTRDKGQRPAKLRHRSAAAVITESLESRLLMSLAKLSGGSGLSAKLSSNPILRHLQLIVDPAVGNGSATVSYNPSVATLVSVFNEPGYALSNAFVGVQQSGKDVAAPASTFFGTASGSKLPETGTVQVLFSPNPGAPTGSTFFGSKPTSTGLLPISSSGTTVSTNIGSGLNYPDAVAVDSAGDVFVADAGNNVVKEILPDGTTKSIGPRFSNPLGVAVDAAGDVFVAADTDGLIEVLPNGTTKTILPGPNSPQAVAVDAAGDLFVAEGIGSVQEVLTSGAIKTISSGFIDPTGVAVDSAGNVYVAALNSSKAITEVLADGTTKFIGSGIGKPLGVAVDDAGDVFVTDASDNTVKEILPNGTTKTISSGFNDPQGVAVDAARNIYVADEYNNRVVKLSTSTPVTGANSFGLEFVYNNSVNGNTKSTFTVFADPNKMPVLGSTSQTQPDFLTAPTGQSISATAIAPSSVRGSLVPGVSPVRGFEGQSTGTVTLANFIGTGSASSYSATVKWGDGTSSSGTITISNGIYKVTSSHTYDDESGPGTPGSQPYKISIAVKHNSSTPQIYATTATIADSPLDELAGENTTLKANTFYSNLLIGTFRDKDATNNDGLVYKGTINWGDGTTSAARFTFNGKTPNVGSFWLVKGSHTYTKKKTYTMTIDLDDTGSPTVMDVISGTVKVV
jgi:hypothetical protein